MPRLYRLVSLAVGGLLPARAAAHGPEQLLPALWQVVALPLLLVVALTLLGLGLMLADQWHRNRRP